MKVYKFFTNKIISCFVYLFRQDVVWSLLFSKLKLRINKTCTDTHNHVKILSYVFFWTDIQITKYTQPTKQKKTDPNCVEMTKFNLQ